MTTCGVYKAKITVGGKEYKEKSFDISCGTISMKAKQLRADFLFNLELAIVDTMHLYGDSLKTKVNYKHIEHTLRYSGEILPGERGFGFFIWSAGANWTVGKDTLSIDFDGVFYCGKQRVGLPKVLIITG